MNSSTRYLVTSQRQVLAVLGFGASAWKAAPRDRFIGWSVAQREARLHLVVNNARFLILPWVQVRNLASLVLARSSRRLPDDWQARYGYRPLLLETFVQSDRFAGTSYRATTGPHVGQTQGRGKLDVHRTHALPRKDIWLDQHLSEAFFTLNLLAFYIHQIFELVDGLYQRVRTFFSSRRAFWDEDRR